jgi:hypothetical protein
VIDPQKSTIYVTVGAHVLNSTDGAESWNETGLPGANSLTIDPRDPSTLYAAASAGVYTITFVPRDAVRAFGSRLYSVPEQ